MHFGIYGLRKMWLDIWVKSPFSEEPLRGNMVDGPKHCCNLNHSTATLFIDHFEGYWVGKSLFF